MRDETPIRPVADSRVIDLAQRKGKGLMKLMKHVALVASMLTLGSVATVAVASPADQDPITVNNSGMMMGTSYQNDVSLPLYYLPSREIDQDAEGKEGPENPLIDTGHRDLARVKGGRQRLGHGGQSAGEKKRKAVNSMRCDGLARR